MRKPEENVQWLMFKKKQKTKPYEPAPLNK